MLIEMSPLTNEVPNGPLVGAGVLPVGEDELELDIQVTLLPIHPAGQADLEKFKGKQITISIPELTLKRLQDYPEAERDEMRYTEQYAAVCRKLGYEIMRAIEKKELQVDYALAIDHAGQLITMFVAKMSGIESYEIRRIKKIKEDGTTDLTVLLPQTLYPIDGKNFLLLDEFINTGFTLREVITTIRAAGGDVALIGAFGKLEGTGKLIEDTYPEIPIITVE